MNKEIDEKLIKEDITDAPRRFKVSKMNRETLEEYAIIKGRQCRWLSLGLLLFFGFGIIGGTLTMSPLISMYQDDIKENNIVFENVCDKMCYDYYGEQCVFTTTTNQGSVQFTCENYIIGID